MFLAGVIAVGQVALAAAVTLIPTRSLLIGPLRTFTWTAALAVALLGLIPEAFSELGGIAFALVGVAIAVPMLLEHVSGSTLGQVGRWGLEVAFIGVLVHRVVDGLGLGAFAQLESLRADVLIALSAHAIAVESVVILKFKTVLGIRSAWWRSVWLCLAGISGVALWGQVEMLDPDPAPFVAALTAGVLLHVATHDVRHPKSDREVSRWLHFLAAILGVLITQLPGAHSGESHGAGHGFTAWHGLVAVAIALLPVALITWRKQRGETPSHP